MAVMGHSHTHEYSSGDPVLLRLPRISDNGDIVIPLHEIGVMSVYVETKEDGTTVVHKDQTLIYVKCVALNVLIDLPLAQVLSRLGDL